MQDEDEVDPLDAYMASIEAEVKEAESKELARPRKPAMEAKAVVASFASDVDAEGAEDEEGRPSAPAGHLETAQDIIAYAAQKVGKRKDLSQVDHAAERYEPFRKNFYIEPPAISEMGEAEVEAYRQALDGIKIRGKRCPRPIRRWTQCGLDSRVLEVIRRAGYERPTPIQAQSIPAVMAGRDIIGIAKTGSGKTVAFLLPMLRHVLDQRPLGPTEGPVALVMSPTRELAMQIYLEAFRFARPLGLRVVCASGGAPIKEQIADLRRGAEILIATPGRLLELLVANSGRVTNLRRVTYLVLDEADRMFDMGFGPQVLRVVGNVRPDKQAVLFSATFPRQMEALARKVLVKPLEIVVGGRSVVCDDVEQAVEVLAEEEKFVRLLEILGEWYPARASRILVFVDRQDAADNLLRDLLRRGYPCLSIHGGKDQADRDSAIEDFKAGVAPILVATSVAARGLDVRDLRLVVNYECPNHMEDYVHRVGRTGRAGSKGTALTMITPQQGAYAGDIARALRASGVDVPTRLQSLVQEFDGKLREGTAKASSSGFGGKGLERIDEEHERARRLQKRSALGDEASSDDEEEEEEEEEKEDELIHLGGDDEAGAPRTVPGVAEQLPGKQPRREASSGAIPQEALAAIRSLNAKIGQDAAFDALAEVNKRYSRAAASTAGGSAGEPSRLGEIVPIYPVLPAGSEPVQPRAYFCEIELNDFPQIVRFRVVHKDQISQVQEYSAATCTIRGVYYPSGKTPQAGEPRKLHIRIDAESLVAVERARAEIRRLLHEYTMEAASKGSIDYERYQL
jgi:ATP-dependent RNA helicase DDX46/PRP5